ncbi:MAG: TIGR03790 family protein [Desulfobacteraceae bacterium]|nr:TIGR03790 family protein [Desulfobacteraceae bacterium]
MAQRFFHPCFFAAAALLFLFSVFSPASPCRASLRPDEIAVIANGNVEASVSLARFYMESRGIPAERLLVLSLPATENISRSAYEKDALLPVRDFLKGSSGTGVRCLLTMYGIPLSVAQPDLTPREKAELDQLRTCLAVLRAHGKTAPGMALRNELHRAAAMNLREIARFDKSNQAASFDSELSLALEENYPLDGWLPNPDFLGYRNIKIRNMPAKTFMVSRLDGPTPAIVSRIIEDSLQAEAQGLRGTAYFDARGPMSSREGLRGYALYDASIHLAAEAVRASRKTEVVLDESDALFKPGQCPNAALYCGWYSLGKYIPAFSWVKGAVGYHIASAECTTLKRSGSTVWCKAMLENGVAATIGPVGEPYVEAFPVPEIFFKALLGGDLTLVESYSISSPFLSWKMVLIGDPLYRPFAHSPR